LMYEYWFPPASIAGKDLLLVASTRDMIDEIYYQNYVEDMDQIQELEIKKDGNLIEHFYLRLVRRYHLE
jgi:hypothetical protein